MTGNHTVFEAITVFLERKAQNSENTRSTYERAIREFFRAMKDKELEDLTAEDIVFSKPQIESYQVGLRNNFKSSTVNTKLFALKSLYKKFQDYNYPVSPTLFELDNHTLYDKETADPMTHDEIVEAIRIVSTTKKGKQKALLIRLAYATAFRKETLLSMTDKNIVIVDGVTFVKVLGKGNKWDYKKISDELHAELLEQIKVLGTGKVFTLTPRTVVGMMKLINSKIDFGDRKIVFHSLKKSSIEEVRIITGNDLKAMQNHGNHASALTTMNDYLSRKKLEDLVVVDINYNIPVEKFDELSREELLHLVKNMDRNTQIKMLRRLGAI